MIKVKAPAKINLCLDILSTLENGYHSVWMVMQTVGLFDIVTVEKTQSKTIEIFCDKKDIPTDDRNIAYKAAQCFFDEMNVVDQGLKISIEKHIPSSAGLAGGSSDGAAVLVAMNKLFETNLNEHELCKIGAKIGADVPFCIVGGTVLAQDIGQIMAKLPDFTGKHILVVKPERSISTKEAYDSFEKKERIRHLDTSNILHLCAGGDYKRAMGYFENVFEQLVEVPERVDIKTVMRNFGCDFTLMSGSGPSVYGVFEDEKNAKKCAEKCREKYKDVFVCTSEKSGCQIFE
ncbi:MAG: 4-(cytidine 5'-diphospho)-2-C-methyl-D-erythritol kinase [Clostridia bacterium]|nr:4-(cytidine 5'-diphospho)-2-C-methyl-D-erythritol kinase [Clostridia bacterium]